MIEFSIPLKKHLFNFLLPQIVIDDLGFWDFTDNHWFGKIVIDEFHYKIDTRPYTNLKGLTERLKVRCKRDHINITKRALYKINAKIENQFYFYLFEWVRVRCFDGEPEMSIKQAILNFIKYYNINDKDLDYDSLNKYFIRYRGIYNIPHLYNVSHG